MSERIENRSVWEKFKDDIDNVEDFVESIQDICSRLLKDTDNRLMIEQIVIEISDEIMYVIHDLICKPGYREVILDYVVRDIELRAMVWDDLDKINEYVWNRIRLIIVHLKDFGIDEKKMDAALRLAPEKSKLAKLLIHCSEVMYIHYLLILIKQHKGDYDFWNNLDDFMGKYWDIFFYDLNSTQNIWNENSAQEEIKKAKKLVSIFYGYVSWEHDFEEVLSHVGARKIFREFLEYFIAHDKIVKFPLEVVKNPLKDT